MRKRSKGLIGASLSIAAVVLVAAFLVSTRGNLLAQCSSRPPHAFPGPDPQNLTRREQFSVLLADPGQTAKVCVGYEAYNDNSSVILQLEPLMVTVGGGTTALPINVTAEPSGSLTAPHGVECGNSPCPEPLAYAVYTITIPNGTKGFYVLQLPGDCPTPFAVGYPWSEVNASDFGGWPNQAFSCSGSSQVDPYTVVYSNLNITFAYVS
jgi:hypothetical protein